MPINLPTNMLRNFVAIADAGSMVSAANQVHVTQSALSLQLRKLEDLLQQQLFRRDARLHLTAAGELLLHYARRVVKLHDEAVAAVISGGIAGPVRMGMVQDFAESLLSGLLSRYAELHPDVEIYARVAGTAELKQLLDTSQLDVAIGFAAPNDPAAVAVAPMSWFGAPELMSRAIVPLATLEQPCRFRDAAIRAFDDAGIAWRIVVETPNLTTLRAAVKGGLGVTCRTPMFLQDVTPMRTDLYPPLADVSCVVHLAEGVSATTIHLAEMAREVVAQRQFHV